MADKPSRVSIPAVRADSHTIKQLDQPTVFLILNRIGAGAKKLPAEKSEDSPHGQGTPIAEYLSPKCGPFRCDHCEYFADWKGRLGLCRQETVVTDPEMKKEDGRAVVAAGGCCRFFEAQDKDGDEQEPE